MVAAIFGLIALLVFVFGMIFMVSIIEAWSENDSLWNWFSLMFSIAMVISASGLFMTAIE